MKNDGAEKTVETVETVETPEVLSHEEQLAAATDSVEEANQASLDAMFSFPPKEDEKEGSEKEALQGEAEGGEDVSGEEDEGDGEDEEGASEGTEEDDEEVEGEEAEKPDPVLDAIAKLNERFDKLEGKEEEAEEIEVETEGPPTFDATEILTQEEYDDTDTHEGMNRALVKVAQQATEFVMKNQVSYIQNLVNNQVTQQFLVRQFYADNPDMVEHKKSTSAVYKTLQSEFPEATVTELFTKLPGAVRALKGLKAPKKAVVKKPVKNKQKPGQRFVKGGGSRSTKVTPTKPDGIASEVAAMGKV